MIVGITGSIAMGKSVVTNYLMKLGYPIIDSDKLVKEEYNNESTIKAIISHFGSSILTNDKIDRNKLGQLIFSNPKERESLNNIIHPKVIEKIKLLTKNNDGIIFVDIPLLYEVNLDKIVDKVIVIYTSKETQIQRLMARDNISKDYAMTKILSQLDIEFKKSKADFLINNEFGIEDTHSQIDEIIRRLKNEV